MKLFLTFQAKQANLVRWSPVMSLPLQLVFPVEGIHNISHDNTLHRGVTIYTDLTKNVTIPLMIRQVIKYSVCWAFKKCSRHNNLMGALFVLLLSSAIRGALPFPRIESSKYI
jgi:hypothetical protein